MNTCRTPTASGLDSGLDSELNSVLRFELKLQVGDLEQCQE